MNRYSHFVMAVIVVCNFAITNLAAGTDENATYIIRFPEFGQVGRRYELEMKAEQRMDYTVSTEESEPESQQSHANLEMRATVEILNINEQRQEIKRSYLIHKATITSQGQTIEILPPETVVVAEAAQPENKYHRTDGVQLSKFAVHLLPQLISFDNGEVGLDQVYGSDTPRKEGDTWDADIQKLIAGMKERGHAFNEKEVSSTAALNKVRVVDREVIFDIGFYTEIDITKQPSQVPDTEPIKATMSISQSVEVPETPKYGPTAQSYIRKIKQELRGKQGTSQEGKMIESIIVETRNAKYKIMPMDEGASDDAKQ